MLLNIFISIVFFMQICVNFIFWAVFFFVKKFCGSLLLKKAISFVYFYFVATIFLGTFLYYFSINFGHWTTERKRFEQWWELRRANVYFPCHVTYMLLFHTRLEWFFPIHLLLVIVGFQQQFGERYHIINMWQWYGRGDKLVRWQNKKAKDLNKTCYSVLHRLHTCDTCKLVTVMTMSLEKA